jgi:6-phosphofructokinase 2
MQEHGAVARIATLTLNPTIDVSFEVDRIVPTHKMRGDGERHDPGGGGINVARVVTRLGGDSRCYYLSGGATGAALDALIDQLLLARSRVQIRGETRVSTSVFERSSRLQYRFVTSGPEVAPVEWQQCLESLSQRKCEYLVASGSLPPGAPDHFYALAATVAARQGARFVLDSSGRGLAGGLEQGGVFLVKPSLAELAALVGQELSTDDDIAEAARTIVDRGAARHVAVTMGEHGAMLVNGSGVLRLAAIATTVVSAVGCGDSFLAAMVQALAEGSEPEEAFRFGMAGGAAATLTPGTSLARAEDIHRLYAAGRVLAR